MIINRDIIQRFADWKDSKDRLPLIVQGARQIGKSWAIEQFGKQYFENVAVFNFDTTRELREIFSNTKDVKRLINNLRLFVDVPIEQGKTLIFFDEVQNCKDALNSLKYFAEDAPGYHVVAAGSLLGVATRSKNSDDEMANSFPVGKVTFINMYPVTFKEFVAMADPTLIQKVEHHMKTLDVLPTILFNKLQECFLQFQVCGGLPKPCSHMLDHAGIATIDKDLEDLKHAYEFDFTKHVDAHDIPRIHQIWESIPSQLSKENRKFVFRLIREGARAREYESALDWLSLSGMIYRIYCVENVALPVKFYENTTAFKVYMLDQALLRVMAELPAEAVVGNSDLMREFKGASAENFVLSSLLAQGFKLPHYWTIQGNKAEVDFMIQHGLDIIPIEVKAGTNIKGQSLIQYDKKYNPRLRVRFSMRNISKDGNLLNLPIFLCDWLRDFMHLAL